jgi:NRAMP (natural resistance-associated macrophage protein)-like metal ion transporter
VKRKMVAALAVLGPGLIAANAGNDAGGIATYASAGAQFVYRTLFVMVIVTIALIVVQEMAARLGVYTGEGLVSLIREQFPLRWGAFAATCLVVANVGLVVAEFAGIGAALELLHVSRYLSVPLAGLALWSLVAFGSYRYVERVFLVFTLPFLAYPIAAVLGHPHWSEVASNTVVPHLATSRTFLVVVVALVGTTITPYMQLYQAAAVADRGTGVENYRAARRDAITGSVFCNVISMTIIIATAAAIGGSGPLSSTKQAALALEPVAGKAATTLFAIGLLGASALAAAVVPLSTSYAISEAVGAERSVSRRFREAPLFLGLFTGQIVIGVVVALAPGNLIDLLINTQILNGIISPIFLVFILVLANRRDLLGGAANKGWFKVLATVMVGLTATLAVAVVGITVAGWF